MREKLYLSYELVELNSDVHRSQKERAAKSDGQLLWLLLDNSAANAPAQ